MTALSTLAFVSFSVWDKYIESPELTILHNLNDKANFSPQLTLFTKSGTPQTLQLLRVVVQNDGTRSAKRCLARLELIRHLTSGKHLLSTEPKTLYWADVPKFPHIPPKAKFSLNVAASQKGLDVFPKDLDSACDGRIRAYVFTEDALNLLLDSTVGPFARLQDAMCIGDYLVKITVYADNAQPAEEHFVISVSADWQKLSMKVQRPAHH